MDYKELLAELRTSYDKIISEHGLQVSYEEYESLYGLQDAILKDGHMPYNLTLYISWRASEYLYSWYNYFHNILMPQPSSILHMEESSYVSEEHKNVIRVEMRKIMAVARKVNIALALKDNKMAADAINELTILWKESTKEIALSTLNMVKDGWSSVEEDDTHASYSY